MTGIGSSLCGIFDGKVHGTTPGTVDGDPGVGPARCWCPSGDPGSSTRKDFPWTNSHHIAGDLRMGVQQLKEATPAGVLLGSG